MRVVLVHVLGVCVWHSVTEVIGDYRKAETRAEEFLRNPDGEASVDEQPPLLSSPLSLPIVYV